MAGHLKRKEMIKLAQYVKCLRFCIEKRQQDNALVYINKLENLVQESLLKRIKDETD